MSRLSSRNVVPNACKNTGIGGAAAPEINIEEPDNVQVLKSQFDESPEKEDMSEYEESPLRLRNAVMRSSDFNYNSF